MSKEYSFETEGHKSIYVKDEQVNYNDRKFNVCFSIPDNGVNSDTGIILFISGFGGNANSNVYKKMRKEFADKYNMVTVQCDYFGWEFMQEQKSIYSPNFNIDELKKNFSVKEIEYIYKDGNFDIYRYLEMASNYNINVKLRADLSNENLSNFNDMSIMQAIDNITAVLKVMAVLYNNNYEFNTKKVIIYGHSHGAYLAYLCNIFAPTLFSLIIDNSAWLYPGYIKENRCIIMPINNMILNVEFDYLAKTIDIDEDLISLSYLYSNFKNNCNIVSYHGITDNLISHKYKKSFCESIENCTYNEINVQRVDGKIFKSTNHGLDADFLELFELAYQKFADTFDKDCSIDLQNDINIKTKNGEYLVNYHGILPKFTILNVT
ncbi:DUF2920 family protein [Tepidibacter mesophilus]|uniref:DUF2920 family protein n=1 Tax=Tepidibacter mesophilus TaxID=655607 RepID=UPI000C06FBE8|nr:DUF2920 family protein [Tepidibacter mesophilus]